MKCNYNFKKPLANHFRHYLRVWRPHLVQHNDSEIVLKASVQSSMKLATIWKDAHSHFHGTCRLHLMHCVNITRVAHAFICDFD